MSRKKKINAIENVVPLPVERVYEIVRTNPLQFAPHHVGDINGLMYVVTTPNSAEREPFVKTCLGMSKKELDELYDIVHKRAPEYDALQSRHSADIRKLKDELSSLWRNGHNKVRPASIHVVSENPTMYRMTAFTDSENPIFTNAGTADVMISSFSKDEFASYGENYDGYSELVDDGSNPTCPVCGSPWQLIGALPLVHCCRCNSTWAQFSRKVVATGDITGPAELSAGLPDAIVDNYLSGEYKASNPKFVDTIIDTIRKVPGKKVVELHYAMQHDSGDTDEIAFQAYDGTPHELRHFVECMDTALCKCGLRGDKYDYTRKPNLGSLIVSMYVPDSDDVDLDAFDELLGTQDQPSATHYAFMVMFGMLSAMPIQFEPDTDLEEMCHTRLGDISKFAPYIKQLSDHDIETALKSNEAPVAFESTPVIN